MRPQTAQLLSFLNRARLGHMCVSVAFLLGACGSDESPEPVDELLAHYSASPECPFTPPEGVNVECGTLTVPEDYEHPEGRKIELALAIFSSTSGEPAEDPLVYLAGGPGAAAVTTLAMAGEVLVPLVAERALIAFDQRGTGLSNPALTCPEVDAARDPSSLESAVEACRDRWQDEGVDLSQYTTLNSARDLAGLRRALGLSQWNVLGTSYGTRLALELMREDPEGLRSVVLDSALSPDLDAIGEMAPAVERAFQQVFDACANDPACHQPFADLEARFYALLEQLDEAPIAGHLGDGSEVPLDGATFLKAMGVLLYDIQGIPLIPQIVAEAEAGMTTTLDAIHLLDRVQAGEGLATGMNFSVVCAEYAPLTSAEKIAAWNEGVQPEMAEAFSGSHYLVACPLWDVPEAPQSQHEAVSSDIPTLILAGEFDPSTPPAWSEHVAETLSRGQYQLFEAASHGVILTPCGLMTMLEFLHDPSSQASPACLADDTSALWSRASEAQD